MDTDATASLLNAPSGLPPVQGASGSSSSQGPAEPAQPAPASAPSPEPQPVQDPVAVLQGQLAAMQEAFNKQREEMAYLRGKLDGAGGGRPPERDPSLPTTQREWDLGWAALQAELRLSEQAQNAEEAGRLRTAVSRYQQEYLSWKTVDQRQREAKIRGEAEFTAFLKNRGVQPETPEGKLSKAAFDGGATPDEIERVLLQARARVAATSATQLTTAQANRLATEVAGRGSPEPKSPQPASVQDQIGEAYMKHAAKFRSGADPFDASQFTPEKLFSKTP